MDFIKECEDFAKNIDTLLTVNTEWEKRFCSYSKGILDKQVGIKAKKELFHQWNPLNWYLNVSNAKGVGHFGIRYLGQEVASMKIKNGDVTISTKKYDDSNLKNFACSIKLNDVSWVSDEAKKFRAYFSTNPKRIDKEGKNEEHRIESLLLTEFSKTVSKAKKFKNIQPVTLAGFARFPMPTPLGASNPPVKYSNQKGGGIDLLARVGKGRGTKLCIFEIKDENKNSEPPKKALQQALAYSVFILRLLRSDCGNEWWNIFGFSGSVPEKLDILVSCLMPSETGMNDKSFAGEKIIVGKDSFTLHYAYFEEKANEILSIDTSI